MKNFYKLVSVAVLAALFVGVVMASGYLEKPPGAAVTDPTAYTVILDGGLKVSSILNGSGGIALAFLEDGVGTAYSGELPATSMTSFTLTRESSFGSSVRPATLLAKVAMTSAGMTIYLKGVTYQLDLETDVAFPLDCYRDGYCVVVNTDEQWWRCFRCCFWKPNTCLPH